LDPYWFVILAAAINGGAFNATSLPIWSPRRCFPDNLSSNLNVWRQKIRPTKIAFVFGCYLVTRRSRKEIAESPGTRKFTAHDVVRDF
jgi:hypothetical protein